MHVIWPGCRCSAQGNGNSIYGVQQGRAYASAHIAVGLAGRAGRAAGDWAGGAPRFSSAFPPSHWAAGCRRCCNQEGAPPKTRENEANKRPADRVVVAGWLGLGCLTSQPRFPHHRPTQPDSPTAHASLLLPLPQSAPPPVCLSSFIHLKTWARGRSPSSRDLSRRLGSRRSLCIGIHVSC